jgi:TolB-like protein/Flp pilus assembly protein TadD
MTLPAGSRLGPYEILSPLGAGGMGVVYRARDARLDRDVAIKVLPESVAADAEALARFRKEAKAIAALSHPNILSIFDFGTHEGVAYAVMELLEGETLRGKLANGPVDAKQAVDYALQIARGLSAAHSRGIVHRDLKPENLFVTRDGHLKILDFGLAKRVPVRVPTDETNAPTSSATIPGTILGTLGYMSPEQVRGEPIDDRSDIFSFGVILYELLTGQNAFKRDSASDTLVAILRDEPPEFSELGLEIPPGLDHIVRHCLEKDREKRFQSAKDIAFDLSEQSSPVVAAGVPRRVEPSTRRRMLAAVAAVLGLATAGAFLARRALRRTAGVKRLAVLPFENLGSPEDDYFADGMADQVRGKLTLLPGVQVIARGSSTPYKKTTKTPRQIAEELGVSHLLTATVRWQKRANSSRVLVTPELIEVSGSGAPTSSWQQPFDAALTDVFQVQSDIATRVAKALGVVLEAGEEKRLSAKPTQNLAAYDAFLKGEEASNSLGASDPPSLRTALGFYEQAVALDPGFAQAWARISWASSLLYTNSTPLPELAARARQAADKAVALAPDRPEGYLASGRYQWLVVKDFNRALEEYTKGLRVAPASVDLVTGMTSAEQALGHWEAAMEHLRQAKSMDPRSVFLNARLGLVLLYLHRYAEAREALDQGLSLTPANLSLILYKTMSFLAEGNLNAARAVVAATPREIPSATRVAFFASYNDLVWVLDDGERDLLLTLPPAAFDGDEGVWALCLAQAYALKRDAANVRVFAEQARKAFEEQLRAAPENAQRHAILGLALAFAGRKEEAIREAERAVALGPLSKDAYFGPYYQHQLVRTYILTGELEKALDKLAPLLVIPYFLSPGWLRIDPNFDPLRGNPRFQQLAAGGK